MKVMNHEVQRTDLKISSEKQLPVESKPWKIELSCHLANFSRITQPLRHENESILHKICVSRCSVDKCQKMFSQRYLILQTDDSLKWISEALKRNTNYSHSNCEDVSFVALRTLVLHNYAFLALFIINLQYYWPGSYTWVCILYCVNGL